MEKKSCETCNNFEPVDSTCRLHCPSHNGWPKVKVTTWCSQWASQNQVTTKAVVKKVTK
jgi:hypothetical protein